MLKGIAILGLLALSTVQASAEEKSGGCIKILDCMQRLVEETSALRAENQRLSSRIGQLEAAKSAIIAFDAQKCPDGWELYTPAEGRFLRGFDPKHPVAIGAIQEDAFQYHTFGDNQGRYLKYSPMMHTTAATNGYSDMYDTGIYGANPVYGSPNNADIVAFPGQAKPRIDDETRPKNVTVLFCKNK